MSVRFPVLACAALISLSLWPATLSARSIDEARARLLSEVDSAWKSRSLEEAGRQSAKLRDTLTSGGVVRAAAVAAALRHEISVALEAGDQKRAEDAASLLKEIDPESSESTYARSLVEMRNWPAVHVWCLSLAKSLWQRALSPEHHGRDAVFLFWWVALAFCLAATVFFVCQILRYSVHVFHGLSRLLPGAYSLVSVSISVAVLLGLSLVYFHPLVTGILVLGLLSVFQSTGERVFSIIVILLIGVSPWLLRVGDLPAQRALAKTAELYRGSLDPTARIDFEDHKGPLGLFVRGLTEKRLGLLDSSLKTLQEAERLVVAGDPVYPMLHNGLGVVYLGLTNLPKAREHFEISIEALPGAAEAHFNLSRVSEAEGKPEEGESHARKASAINPTEVTRWEAVESDGLNMRARDLYPGVGVFLEHALDGVKQAVTEQSPSWNALMGSRGPYGPPIAALVILLALGMAGFLRSRFRFDIPCEKCLRPVAIRVIDLDVSSSVCDQCTNIFFRSVPVDRQTRFEKERRVAWLESARRWGTRVLSLVFPGAGHLARGDSVRGGWLVFLCSLLLITFLVPGIWFDVGSPPSGGGWFVYVVAVVLPTLYVRSAMECFRRTKVGGEWA